MGLQAPDMSLSFPGIGSDYSSLLRFGNNSYSPVSDYLGSAPKLAAQVGAVGTGSAVARPDFFSLDSFMGGANADGIKSNGWGGLALGGLQGLGNLYMGMQQYGLARDQLQFSKDAFNKNYGAQKITTNNQIRSRNFARNAANPGMYQNMTEIA